jgi:MFS family permease
VSTGTGIVSLLANMAYEVPTALMPAFFVTALGAGPLALGVIEGVRDALSGPGRFAGGSFTADPARRQGLIAGSYSGTAILSSLIGVVSAVWQVGMLRGLAAILQGFHSSFPHADLNAAAPGRAGHDLRFSRAMELLGIVIGPLVALVLAGLAGIRVAILVSVIPGMLAAFLSLYSIRRLPRPAGDGRGRMQLQMRSVMRSSLRPLLLAVAAFELGNIALTLLILRATDLLLPLYGEEAAIQIAIALYALSRAVTAAVSVPAGRTTGRRSISVLSLGAVMFALAFAGFALTGPGLVVLAGCFIAAGVGVGCAEISQQAVLSIAPSAVRASAIGALVAIQSGGKLAASALCGGLWAALAPSVGFLYASLMMAISCTGLLLSRRRV